MSGERRRISGRAGFARIDMRLLIGMHGQFPHQDPRHLSPGACGSSPGGCGMTTGQESTSRSGRVAVASTEHPNPTNETAMKNDERPSVEQSYRPGPPRRGGGRDRAHRFRVVAPAPHQPRRVDDAHGHVVPPAHHVPEGGRTDRGSRRRDPPGDAHRQPIRRAEAPRLGARGGGATGLLLRPLLRSARLHLPECGALPPGDAPARLWRPERRLGQRRLDVPGDRRGRGRRLPGLLDHERRARPEHRAGRGIAPADPGRASGACGPV